MANGKWFLKQFLPDHVADKRDKKQLKQPGPFAGRGEFERGFHVLEAAST